MYVIELNTEVIFNIRGFLGAAMASEAIKMSIRGIQISVTQRYIFQFGAHIQPMKPLPLLLACPSLRPITCARVSTDGVQGNQIHGNNLWILGILKMYMGILGYFILITFLTFWHSLVLYVKSRWNNLWFPYTFSESPGSVHVEYCYVFRFLGPRQSLP